MNGFHLKLLALATMMLDHAGALFFPQHPWMRIVGRLAFPIYCFLLVEGLFHTRDARRYLARLLAFAVLSEIPFDLAFFGAVGRGYQNIFFTLFIGLFCIAQARKQQNRRPVLLGALAAGMLAAEVLSTDYGALGILYIFIFYLLRNPTLPERSLLQGLSLFSANTLLSGGIQHYAAFAVLPLTLYSGAPGPRGTLLKYGFYLMYPLHLTLFYLIRM